MTIFLAILLSLMFLIGAFQTIKAAHNNYKIYLNKVTPSDQLKAHGTFVKKMIAYFPAVFVVLGSLFVLSLIRDYRLASIPVVKKDITTVKDIPPTAGGNPKGPTKLTEKTPPKEKSRKESAYKPKKNELITSMCKKSITLHQTGENNRAFRDSLLRFLGLKDYCYEDFTTLQTSFEDSPKYIIIYRSPCSIQQAQELQNDLQAFGINTSRIRIDNKKSLYWQQQCLSLTY